MEILSNFILLYAIIWIVWQIIVLRRDIGAGKHIIPTYVTFLLIFAIFVLVTVVFQLSPFHLLWLFILSIVLSFKLLVFPVVQKIAMTFVILLAMSKRKRS